MGVLTDQSLSEDQSPMTQQQLPPPPAGPSAGGPQPGWQPQPEQSNGPGWRKQHPKLFWTLVVVGGVIVLGIIGNIVNPASAPTNATDAATTTTHQAAPSET